MILDVTLFYAIISGIVLIMVIYFVSCFCRCCRKIPRDELMGLSGSVKITNPDAPQNSNIPLAVSITRTSSEMNILPLSVPSSNKSTKKFHSNGNITCNSGNATRSLPELPVDAALVNVSNDNEKKINLNNFNNDDSTADTNSDLYATLEEHKISSCLLAKMNIISKIPAYSTSSKTDNIVVTYEQIDENINDTDVEHPYAQVKNDVKCDPCKLSGREESLLGVTCTIDICNANLTDETNTSNTLPIIRTSSYANVPLSSTSTNTTSIKRLNVTSKPGNATRSLPELPIDVPMSNFSEESSGDFFNSTNFYGANDTNSDLYATLEEHCDKAETVTTTPNIFSNEPPYCSSDEPDSIIVTYEQIGENTPYNEIEDPKEHPYAQVRNNTENYVVFPPRCQYNQSDRLISNNTNENSIESSIPAASAIVGNIAASNELPYMTPPLHIGHFSGDSQDSARGYTSITVREPLSCIRLQEVSDSHYTVLSDDSDEMYAAIQEAYTSGSETYAQIQPVSSSNLYNATYSTVPNEFSDISPYNTYSVPRSQEASSSSILDSDANPNSPKEKRQANSPLPKPPIINPDDMYAKVNKKRKKVDEAGTSKKDDVLRDNEVESSNKQLN